MWDLVLQQTDALAVVHGLQQLQNSGFVAPWHVGILVPHWGLNPRLLHCKVDS